MNIYRQLKTSSEKHVDIFQASWSSSGMPVTSKCDQLEFANSMALCVLQVLGYGHMSWGPWRIKKTDSYIIISLSTIQVCSIQVWIGHESLSCWKQSILFSGSGPHMFCREVAIHDECVDQLIADT